MGLALIFLGVAFLLLKKRISVPWKIRGKIWLAGLFMQGFPMALLFWGERTVSPGLAGVLNATMAIWVFILGSLFFPKSENFSFQKLVGLIVSILGVLILFWPILFGTSERSELWGAFAVVLMGLSYAIGTLMNRVLLSGQTTVDFHANLYQQLLSSSVFLLVLSSIFESWPSLGVFLENPSAILALLYLSLCSTALAWLIYFHLVREWGAVRGSAVSYLIPVMALIWDYAVFQNVPGVFESVGTFTILSGILLLNFQPSWLKAVSRSKAKH